jgi:hypothetical protein
MENESSCRNLVLVLYVRRGGTGRTDGLAVTVDTDVLELPVEDISDGHRCDREPDDDYQPSRLSRSSFDASFPTMRVPAPSAIAARAMKRERFSMLPIVDETDDVVVVAGEGEEEEGVDPTVLTVLTATATTVVIG